MEHFLLFIVTSFLLIILPGPDTAIATQNTLTMGKKGGITTVIGTCSAVLIHTFAAVLGLSAIIMKSATFFAIFKYVGAAYLVFLGIKTFIQMRYQQPSKNVQQGIEGKFNEYSCVKQGFLTNILNPKVAVFFLTFLPQFVVSSEKTFFPFLCLGLTYCFIKFIWYVIYIYMIDLISEFMKRPSIKRLFEGITGIIFIGFGVKLALEKAQ